MSPEFAVTDVGTVLVNDQGLGFDSATGFVVIESLFRGRFDVFVGGVRHLILPAIALSTIATAANVRVCLNLI